MPYSPYINRYSASETAPLCKIEILYMTQPLGSHTCSLFAHFTKVIMCPCLALSTLILPQYTILVQIQPCLSIFSQYLALIALILPYMPYSPYIYRYSAIETAHLRKIERLYMTSYDVFLINFRHNMLRPPPPQYPKLLKKITSWPIHVYEELVI